MCTIIRLDKHVLIITFLHFKISSHYLIYNVICHCKMLICFLIGSWRNSICRLKICLPVQFTLEHIKKNVITIQWKQMITNIMHDNNTN